MATYLGLDIGTKTITGVVVTGSGKKIQIDSVFVEEIPDLVGLADGPPTAEAVDLESGLPPSVGEVVKKILEDRKLVGVEVVASVDAKDCVIRDRISVPFTRSDQIDKTIAFEAENHLITFDVDEMVLEYHKVEEQGNSSTLILLAVPDQAVEKRLEVLKEGGVDPVALDLDGAALFNAFRMTPMYDPETSTLVVDVGATTTNVVLIEKGALKMVRSLRLGAFLGVQPALQLAEPAGVGAGGPESGDFELPDSSSIEARFSEIENALRRIDSPGEDGGHGDAAANLDDAINAAFGGSGDEPIAILSDDEFAQVSDKGVGTLATGEPGAGPTDAGEAAGQYDYAEFLRRLGLEIQRTFSTTMFGQVDLVCLTGGMSHREEARQFFTENFDIDTVKLDFGGSRDNFEIAVDDDQREELNRCGAVALGLATKELGRDGLGLDFRKKHFRYERRFERLKFPLLSLGVMTCALFLFTSFDMLKKWRSRGQELEQIQTKEREYYEAFFGKLPPANARLLMTAVASQKKEWNGKLGKGAEIPTYLPEIDAIVDVAEVFKEARQQGYPFDVKTMNMSMQLKAPRRAGKRKVRGQVAKLERDWVVDLTSNERIGEDLKRLFARHSKKQMWEVQTSERTKGDVVSIKLVLTPKRNYLAKLK